MHNSKACLHEDITTTKSPAGLVFAGLNEKPPFSFVTEVCAEMEAPNPAPDFPAAMSCIAVFSMARPGQAVCTYRK